MTTLFRLNKKYPGRAAILMAIAAVAFWYVFVPQDPARMGVVQSRSAQ